ncbi:hypothetical protein FRB95_002317 [Tulasnella sp. JGI-2019a]|nr:hypothetical protein FRB93_005657 [Tulasnella sp. JGI-2019a]KAG9031777.1 hypothetical protein FRB95_002317 [Tulasnella sp. JGI-2019a]
MVQSTRLGGTASHIEIFKFGLGLAGMTRAPNMLSDEDAFETIKAAIAYVPEGQRLLINSAEFYGWGLGTANLELLARFFTKYPELTNRMVLSVKGGMKLGTLVVDGSPENLRRSVDACNAALDGKKRIDIFACARVDKAIPIEEEIRALKALVEEGKFDHIGLSEVAAETIRRANSVHGIAAVEIEVSPWSYEDETRKVIATTQSLEIPIIAYSPLGGGLLTGKVKAAELPANDHRRMFSRFKEDVAEDNQKSVNALMEVAEKKGISAAQLSLAWVSSLGPNLVPIPGSVKVARTKENFEAAKLGLSEEELGEIDSALAKYPVKGSRFFPAVEKGLWG